MHTAQASRSFGFVTSKPSEASSSEHDRFGGLNFMEIWTSERLDSTSAKASGGLAFMESKLPAIWTSRNRTLRELEFQEFQASGCLDFKRFVRPDF